MKMAGIIDIHTLPQSDMLWKETVTINLDHHASFSMDASFSVDEPNLESRNDDFTDSDMRINDETTVNVKISDNQINQEVKVMNIVEDANVRETLSAGNFTNSDNEISEDFQEFKGMSGMENPNLNQAVVRVDMESLDSKINDGLLKFTGINTMEDTNLRQALVEALSRGICEDISEFNRKQNSLYNNVQGSTVDNQAGTDGLVGCQPDAQADTSEDVYPFAKESSFPFATVKTEESSFPFAKVKTERNEFPFTHIKTERDTSDTDTAYSSETETTLESQVELQPYDDSGAWDTGSSPTVIKKEPGADNAETHPDQPVRSGLQNQQLNHIKMCSVLLSQNNTPLDTEPHPVTEVRSKPATNKSLKNGKHTNGTSAKAKPRVKKVQKNVTSKIVNSQKQCLVCNAPCFITENKKFPILPFCGKCKRAYTYQRARSYMGSTTSICRSRGACRIDYRQEKKCPRCHYTKFLSVLSAAQRIFKEPFQHQICRRYSRKEASKQKKHDWSIIRDEILLQEALIFQPRVLLKRIDNGNMHTSFQDPSKGQRCGTTSAIHEGNIKLIRKDQSEARELAALANLDGMGIENGNPRRDVPSSVETEIEQTQREIPSVISPGSLLKSVSETSMPTARSHLLKDMFSQCANVDPAANRLVSRYSGRVIRRKNVRCYSYDTFQQVAKTRYTATKGRKTTSSQPSKVAVFICGHVCGKCNGRNADKWLGDHGYSKSQPLSHVMRDETLPKLTAETPPTKDALILNKLRELNQLLQDNSNLVIEVKKRPVQQESQIPILPTVNVPTPSPTVQNATDVNVQQISTLGISNTTFSTLLSKLENSKNSKAEVNIPLSKSSPQDMSGEMMKTSLPTISDHEITRIAVETSPPKSSVFKISRDRVGTLIPQISAHELSSNTISTFPSKISTHELSSYTFSNFLPKLSPQELSSNTVSTFPPKISTHELLSSNTFSNILPKMSPNELSSNTMNTFLPNNSAPEILSSSNCTFLSRISLPEISSDTINTYQPQISSLGISSDTVSTSLSNLPKNGILKGVVKTSYEISSDVTKTSLPNCSEISSGKINTALLKGSTHEMQRGLIKTVLPACPAYAVPQGVVSTSASYVCKGVLYKLSSQHLQEQISPAASQPLVHILVPISTSVQQLSVTPASALKQSQRSPIPPPHFLEKQSMQQPVSPPHSVPEQSQPLPVPPPHSNVAHSQQLPILTEKQSEQLPARPPHFSINMSQRLPVLLPDSLIRQHEHLAKHLPQPLAEPPEVPTSPEPSSGVRTVKVSHVKPKLACLVPVIQDQQLFWHLQFNASNA